jgi:hypothetical protein
MNDRLPGIRFEDVPEVLSERLPRMDIAAFAGFARRGPLQWPVVVEDAAQFENLFGGDHLLYADARDGQPVHAQLAPAVRAFFRNGGRRCWVTRVAERPSTARLPLPGLWRGGAAGWRPAKARAVAPGRWGFELATSARLLVTPLALLPGEHLFDGGTPRRLAMDPASAGRPMPGDLLRLSAPTVGDAERDLAVLFVRAGALTRRALGRHGERLDAQVAQHWWWARPSQWPASFELLLSLPRARQLTATREGGVGAEGLEAVVSFSFELPATLEATAWPRRDDPVRLRSAGRLACGRLLEVEAAGRVGGQLRFRARATVLEALPGAVDVQGLPQAERLRLELTVADPEAGPVRLSELGFFTPHPRAWRALPDDEALAVGAVDEPHAALWAECTRPRFALAGLRAADALPIGLPWAQPATLGAWQDRRGGLQRDGLRRFNAGLFLDPLLAELPTEALIDSAEALRHPMQPARQAPRRLLGVHAFLPLEEVTLVAAPDAGLCPWDRAAPATPPLPDSAEPLPDPCTPCCTGTDEAFRPAQPRREAAPHLGLAAAPGGWRLSWAPAAPDAAARWTLQAAADLHWHGAQAVYQGPATALDIDAARWPWRYARVRRDDAAGFSDWSNGVVVAASTGAGWRSTPEDPVAARGVLRVQRALMRLAAARADVVAVLGTPGWMDEAQALRHVAALTRIALPAEDDPLAAGVFAPDERRVPSYGALYHPWLSLAPGVAGVARWIAPEGPACGVIARRALTRGAWVAPANEVLQDALALRVPPGAAAPALFEHGVNLWRSDGLRVRAMGARTLAGEADWRPLNVRRLMQLLRRLLLREGAAWVFEPNGEALHRAVERGLTGWLGLMHARGAFAGQRPAEAWRLTVDGSRAELGRLEVELRVAPSRPMEFITVRLVHQGDRLSTLEI